LKKEEERGKREGIKKRKLGRWCQKEKIVMNGKSGVRKGKKQGGTDVLGWGGEGLEILGTGGRGGTQKRTGFQAKKKKNKSYEGHLWCKRPSTRQGKKMKKRTMGHQGIGGKRERGVQEGKHNVKGLGGV